MYARDAVVKARAAHGKGGHVEVGAAGRAGERHQLLHVHAERGAIAVQVGRDRARGELVVARGHRRVAREDRSRRDRLERGVETADLGHQVTDALQYQERGVTLVDVPDRRAYAHRGERAHTARAEHHLLLDARRVVSAVEPVRDRAVVLAVLGQVGVEQEEPDVTHAQLPHLGPHLAAGQRDIDGQLRAVLALHRRDRQVLEVGIEILGVLVALAVYGLDEVALPVEQPDGHERQLPVTRGLAVVPGEYAQAARVDRHALVKAELGAEVRDQVAVLEKRGVLPRDRLGVVGIEGREDAVEAREKHRVGSCRRQALLVEALQHRLRAVAHRVPQRRVQPREERARRPVPAVPQVARELLEAQQAPRYPRVDFDRVGSGLGHESLPQKNCVLNGAVASVRTRRVKAARSVRL